MATKDEPAVIVKQAYKYYGSNRNVSKKIVLNHLNMNVERGSIYGLLGSSGCGKTTLLSCVVGVRNLISGHIKVLGKEGRKETRTIATRIGYMPQEVALVGEFSIKEAILFFGRLYGMQEEKIEERFDYLSKLLELPPATKTVKKLSGGQQRRVSFAAALVHEPELLILDEPTVGLDPLLREKIWHHLVELSTTKRVAVVITTHYIEEARQANRIGLMRGGQLLAEETPEAVLRKFNCASLEEAFLILSIKQSKVDGSTEEPVIIETNETPAEESPDPEIGEVKNHYDSKEDFSNMYMGSSEQILTNGITNNNNNGEPSKKEVLVTKGQKYRALFSKNITQLVKHPGGLLFSILFPIIQMLAFLMAVGHDIRIIHMGIVNEEVPNFDNCYNTSLITAVYNPEEYTCMYNQLSCRYIKSLDENIIVKHFYNTLEEGLEAVNTGKVVGTLHVAKNFSDSLYRRTEEGSNDDDIDQSFLNFYLDMSNHQISHFVKRKLYDDYQIFAKDLLVDCKSSPKLANIPVHFNDPIYGTDATSYTDFMAPGLMATVLFFLATTATSNLLILDKLEGIWDRTIVAGVDSSEILVVHVIIQSLVILMQVVEVMIITFLGYQVPFRGDISTVAILLVLQGFVGMAYGFFVSIVCNSYSLAFFVSTGSFYPLILLCGIVWPIEGMKTGLRIFSLFLPFTIPIRSLRNIIEKGYGILEFQVLNGYVVSVVWITFLLASCFLILRLQRS